jgi:macrodomain Ter protein organizer (MatP/YcbG family)
MSKPKNIASWIDKELDPDLAEVLAEEGKTKRKAEKRRDRMPVERLKTIRRPNTHGTYAL